MSPFRALATVHVASSWNRLAKRSGLSGLPATIVLFTVLGVAVVLPVGVSMGVLGYVLGTALTQPDSQVAAAFGGLVLSFVTFVSGAMSGLTSGSRQLPWETLRGFPVRAFTIFRAELFAGLGEVMTLLEVGALLVTCACATAAAPRAGGLFLILFLTHALTLLAIQQLFGSLAQRLARRFRAMLILLPIVAISMPWALQWVQTQADGGGILTWGPWLVAATRWLPARLVLDAAAAIHAGTSSPSGLALAVLAPTAVAGLTTWAAYALVARERPLAQPDAGRAERPWRFRAPVWGIARLQWTSLSLSIPGRFGLLMPLFTVLLIRGPMAELVSGEQWAVPAAFGYASLAGTNLLFNQFGLDRHGVKGLFLLPIPAETLLRGKFLGFAAWQGLQAGLLAVLLALSGHHDLAELGAGIALYGCLFLILWMVGVFASIWQPRALRQNGLRAGQMPFVVFLVMFGTLGVAAGALYTITYAVHRWAPGWEFATLCGIGLGLGLLVVPVLHRSTRYLVKHRERLVETLGSAG